MNAVFDIEEVVELSRAAVKSLTKFQPKQMAAVLERKAKAERTDHEYRNRTHYLEKSTFASEPSYKSDSIDIELGARMSYASFVAARHLMTLKDRKNEAKLELAYLFEGEAEALSQL